MSGKEVEVLPALHSRELLKLFHNINKARAARGKCVCTTCSSKYCCAAIQETKSNPDGHSAAKGHFDSSNSLAEEMYCCSVHSFQSTLCIYRNKTRHVCVKSEVDNKCKYITIEAVSIPNKIPTYDLT